jgi:hypothetical protein
VKLWHGKYRGTVKAPGPPTEPPGSLVVNVPQVMGATGEQLALPCFPYTGLVSGTFYVPPVLSAVWVEFEGGNPKKPIWVGGFYPSASPGPPQAKLATPPGTEASIVQTTLQNTISVIDVPGPTGGIMLRAASGAAILINDLGITLQDGMGGVIQMAGGVVKINFPNLVVLR